MVRVGGLQQKVQAGIAYGSGADRMPPSGAARAHRARPSASMIGRDLPLSARATCCPPWNAKGIVFRSRQGPDRRRQRQHLRDVFRREIFPVLTPLAIDPGHPFPHLLNKSLNLAVLLQRPRRRGTAVRRRAGAGRAAALRASLPVEPSGVSVFTPLETVIRLHLPDLFPGMELEPRHRLPRHAQQRIRDRRRRSRGPAQDHRGRGPQAPPRRRGAPARSRPTLRPRSSSS